MMEFDLFTLQGSIETSPDIENLEHHVYTVAKGQIDAEVTPGSFEGPRYLAMIRYRQLKLLKRWDIASFVVKALVIAEIEKRNLWSVFDYKRPEEAAEMEADITPGEYSNIRDLWNSIIPFSRTCGIPVEELLLKKGSNLRVCIPILKSIATNKPSTSQLVNRRIEQINGDVREIAKAKGEPITDDEVRKQTFENVLSLMDGSNKDVRTALDPYAPENAREGDPVNSQYPCLIILCGAEKFILAKVDEDGLAEFLPFLEKRCVVDYTHLEDDPRTYPLIKDLLAQAGSNLGRSTFYA